MHRAGRPIEHVAFYGTLCAGLAPHARLGLATALEPLGRVTIRGTVYDLGAYPGIVLGKGQTQVELYRIVDASIIARLDRYERHNPRNRGGCLFRRASIRVPGRSTNAGAPRGRGRPLDAWLYVFNRSIRGKRPIQGRSWAEHCAKRALNR